MIWSYRLTSDHILSCEWIRLNRSWWMWMMFDSSVLFRSNCSERWKFPHYPCVLQLRWNERCSCCWITWRFRLSLMGEDSLYLCCHQCEMILRVWRRRNTDESDFTEAEMNLIQPSLTAKEHVCVLQILFLNMHNYWFSINDSWEKAESKCHQMLSISNSDTDICLNFLHDI